jgi:YVTN family beta-propeller protein
LVISTDGKTGYLNALEDDMVIVLDLVNNQVTDTYPVVNPIGLALSADESRLYVGTFAGSEYNLWMFDTQSGDVISAINFEHPAPYSRGCSDIEGLALTPDGSTLYAASVDADGVFVLDPATLEPVGMIPMQAIASFLPFRAVISPDGVHLYVGGGTQRPTTVSVIDTTTLQVVGEIVSDRGGPCVQPSYGLDLSPDGSRLYVLSSDGNCVLVVDTQSQSIVDDFMVGVSGFTLTHIAVHPDGDRAYVLDFGGNVHMIDLESHSVLSTLMTNVEYAWTIKLSPDGTRAYVGGTYGYAVVDVTTNTLLKSVDFGVEGVFGYVHGRALGVKPDSSQYLVGEFFNMRVYDAATDEEIRNIDLGEWDPYRPLVRDIIFSPDGNTGYLAMWDASAVIAFDANAWEVTAKIDVGRAPYFGVCPTWLALSPDGSTLFVVCEESDNVVVIDTATNTVIKAIRVGRPYRIHLPLITKNYQ